MVKKIQNMQRKISQSTAIESYSDIEQRIVKTISGEYLPLVDNFYQTRQILIGILNRIDITASMVQLIPVADRDDVLSVTLKGFAGAVNSAFAEWALAADAVNAEIPADIVRDVQQRIIGIKRAFNNKDKGIHLYELAKEHSPIYERIATIRADINVGRPKGMGAAQGLLIELANEERLEKNVSWAKAGQRIKRKLEQMPEDELSPTEYEALQIISFKHSKGSLVERDSRSMAVYLAKLSKRS